MMNTEREEPKILINVAYKTICKIKYKTATNDKMNTQFSHLNYDDALSQYDIINPRNRWR